MSKKLENQSSNNYMHSEPNMEDILNHKFKARIDVSSELHYRILEVTSAKKVSANFHWYVAAGLAILICLNVFSIRTYYKQVKNEQLKEFYTNDWNNPTIF